MPILRIFSSLKLISGTTNWRPNAVGCYDDVVQFWWQFPAFNILHRQKRRLRLLRGRGWSWSDMRRLFVKRRCHNRLHSEWKGTDGLHRRVATLQLDYHVSYSSRPEGFAENHRQRVSPAHSLLVSWLSRLLPRQSEVPRRLWNPKVFVLIAWLRRN